MDHKLVLYATAPESVLSRQSFERILADVGLTGGSVTPPAEGLRPGPRFIALVQFAAKPPSDAAEFFRIEAEVFSEPSFLGGACQDPRCLHCGHVVEDWTTEMSAWLEARAGYVYRCSGCRGVSRPENWNWGRTAGVGTHAVSMWHIHWQEAVPSPTLLAALGAASGCVWDYFFYEL